MSLPDAQAVLAALEATWPAARRWRLGPFTLRDGAGGGKRVSAATANGPATTDDIARARDAMRASGMASLFQVRDDEADLDARLATAGLAVIDPVVLLAGPVDAMAAHALPRLAAIPCEAPLAIQAEIWRAGGIGAARRAVMARAPGPRTWLLGRAADRPAGTAFAALSGSVAMVHALEIPAGFRRQGAARHLMIGAARWAAAHGAAHLAVAVTTANAPARALYASLGMAPVGQYHYRIEDAP